MINILKPKAIHLIIFSVILIPFLYYPIAESVMSLFGISLYFELFIIFYVACVITVIIDVFFKTRTILYVLTATVITITMIFVSLPLMEHVEDKNKKCGFTLGEKIKEYKKINGTYPENLNDTFFDEFQESVNFRYRYGYSKECDEKKGEYFVIWFSSRGGMDAYLYSFQQNWVYRD